MTIVSATEHALLRAAKWFRVRHSGDVVKALNSPAGYEANNPEVYEPLSADEVVAHLSANFQVADPAPETGPMTNAPAAVVTPAPAPQLTVVDGPVTAPPAQAPVAPPAPVLFQMGGVLSPPLPPVEGVPFSFPAPPPPPVS
jgi:hypothetical protein